MRQDRPRIATLDHRYGRSRVAGVFGGEAIVHCDLRRIMCTCGGTRARQSGHSARYAMLTPRPERHMRTFVSLPLLVRGGHW
eukprot:6265080-Alexandrium_andersonii.AAC.1